jgi:DNA helicase II / ATP-dependent DNA helicase PcrA
MHHRCSESKPYPRPPSCVAAGFCTVPAGLRSFGSLSRPHLRGALSELVARPRRPTSAYHNVVRMSNENLAQEASQSSLARLRGMQRAIVERRRRRAGSGSDKVAAAAEAVIPCPSHSRAKAAAASVSRPPLPAPSAAQVEQSEPIARQTVASSESIPAQKSGLSRDGDAGPVRAASLAAPSTSSTSVPAVPARNRSASSSPATKGSAAQMRRNGSTKPVSSSRTAMTTALANERRPTSSSSGQRRQLSLSSESTGTWLLRWDGSLPTKAMESKSNEQRKTLAERVWIPNVDEAMGSKRLATLVRQSGALPRLTAAMAQKSADAIAKSLATASEGLITSEVSAVPASPSKATRIVTSLNEPQQRAVVAEPGRPCVVLAGPGSGKTRVLTHRAAYLVQELGVASCRIIAVTFTNKAAGEMKERIDALLDNGLGRVSGASGDMVVGTFHAICARFLRLHGLGINIASNFDIADTTDTRSVMSALVKEFQPEDCSADVVSDYVRKVSQIKNELGDELKTRLPERVYARTVEMRKLYDAKMRSMNKLDFDDLLVETRRLLNECIDVRHLLQTRFHHVLVDEWQDTNSVQYDIVRILSATHRNLFVVGDGDQSIYKFRGADSRNVDRFADDFKDAQTVALVENYRSTKCIVEASQAVIEKNRNRPEKKMITSNSSGDRVNVVVCEDQNDEVYTITRRLRELVRASPASGFSDVAVLYRTNAQSRPFEEAFVKASIPYRLIGGTRFYERQEIKDLLAYMRLLRNPLDDTSLKRAINVPSRGIGLKTVEALELYAERNGVSMLAALDNVFGENAVENSTGTLLKGASKKRLAEFHDILQDLRTSVSTGDDYTVESTLSRLLDVTDYRTYSSKIGGTVVGAEKAAERWRNVQELLSAASRHSSLDSFLESVALVSDVKDVDDGNGNVVKPQAVSLMTLHSGKGLEFDFVFVAGMEEGLVPMIFNSEKTLEALEEERRLAYVGMTRARNFLHLSWRRRKLLLRSGKSPMYVDSKRSRFLDDIPELLASETTTPAAKSNLWRSDGGGERSSPSRSTSVWKSAGKKSNVTSYSSTGVASTIAAPFVPRCNMSGVSQTFKIGDNVRESTGMRGVVVASSEPSMLEVLFVNGQQRRIPKASCIVLSST